MPKFTTKRFLGIIVGVAFVLTAFFGAHLSMQEDMSGQMQNCPLAGQTQSVCVMSVVEHIRAWKQIFTATLESNKFLPTAFMLLAFVIAAFAFRFSLIKTFDFQPFKSGQRPPEYDSNFLLKALSQGILRKRE